MPRSSSRTSASASRRSRCSTASRSTVEGGETVVVFGPSGSRQDGAAAADRRHRRARSRRHPHRRRARCSAVAPEQRDVGMAFQNFALYPHMTRLRQHREPAAARAGCAEAEIKAQGRARSPRCCRSATCSATSRASCRTARSSAPRSPAPWSRGPGVLLLDDPLRNVDAKLRYEMRLELPRLLSELRLDRALRDAGLSGGDGAGPTGSPCCASGTLRAGRRRRPTIYRRAGERRDRAPVRRSHDQPVSVCRAAGRARSQLFGRPRAVARRAGRRWPAATCLIGHPRRGHRDRRLRAGARTPSRSSSTPSPR